MASLTKILFVSPTSTNIYGAEKALYQLLACLPRDRFEVSLLVLAPLNLDLKEYLSTLPVSIVEMRFRGWCHFAGSAGQSWRRLARLIDNLRVAISLSKSLEQFDVIYSNTTASPIGAIIAALRQIPHIWHIHDHLALEGTYWRFDWPTNLTLKWAERNTAHFICFSDATYSKWAKFIDPSRISLIKPGLLLQSDLVQPRERSIATNEVRLCVVGGITESKGQHEAIQALPLLVQAGLKPKLNLAGTVDKNYQDRLLALIKELGVTDFVEFLGYANAFSVFDRSDIHVMCTRSESAPRVAIESMARGCPTVATDIDGVREFIIDGVTGLTYQLGQPEQLAQKIIQLWSDQQLYHQLSRGGIEFVRDRFMLDQYVENVVQLIEDVASGKQPRPPSHPDEARA